MKLLNKIAFKSVCGAPEMVAVTIKDDSGVEKTVLRGVERPYMRIVGICRSHSVKSSQYGDSVQFEGDFRAIDIKSGEIFNAGKLFLPQIAESYLFNALLAAQGSEGFTGLELGFDVGIKPASTPMGYEYTVAPLIQPEATVDRLSDLLNTMPALPALPQPTETKTKKGE